MLDIRKRIILIVLSSIGFVALLLGSYYFFSKKTPVENNNSNNQETEILPPNIEKNNTTTASVFVPIQPVNQDELLAKQISKDFVERFMTFSNQNNNSHINDALAMSTEGMMGWIESQALNQGVKYSGMTTKLVSSSVKELKDSTAIVDIDAQQVVENTNDQEVKYRSGTVNLLKVNGTWKVDSFYWEKE